MPILGLKQFEAALAKVSAEAEATARLAVAKSAALVEAAAKGNFAGSHKKGEPRVSATVGGRPSPNVVSGMLRRSIKTDPITRYGLGDYGTKVAPRAIYARSVELGNKPGMNAYPYFIPAAKYGQSRFESIAAEQWRRFLLH